MKTRAGPDGLHLFDRQTGLNVLFDEVTVDASNWARAPRQVSVALTNLCDLKCSYCYAPKHQAALDADRLAGWLEDLDEAGCLGIGFGGGEPMLHPQFASICQHAARGTRLAVTVTTHGHQLRSRLLDRISGNIHFLRVSVDGVGSIYESLRGKSYSQLVGRLRNARSVAPLGINVVVNEQTIDSLDAIAALGDQVDACELLLLPQQSTRAVPSLWPETHAKLLAWVRGYSGTIRLAVSEAGCEGFPTCDPLPKEKGTQAYAHIDASGFVKANSFRTSGVEIGPDGVLPAIAQLKASEGVLL